MKKLTALMVTLLIGLAAMASRGDTNSTIITIGKSAGYYSVSHPEWPPVPVPPVEGLTVYEVPNTEGSGDRMVYDDRGLVYPKPPPIVADAIKRRIPDWHSEERVNTAFYKEHPEIVPQVIEQMLALYRPERVRQPDGTFVTKRPDPVQHDLDLLALLTNAVTAASVPSHGIITATNTPGAQ